MLWTLIFLPLTASNYLAALKYHWPAATVPYKLDAGFSPEEKDAIRGTMDTIADKTCIRFVPRTTELHYVNILNTGKHCSSGIGFHKDRTNYRVTFPEGCVFRSDGSINEYAMIHELLHLLGGIHEHSRPDRDEYVTINWNSNDATSNCWKSAWETTPESERLPRCERYVSGIDYSNCINGFVTANYTYPYEFDSVLHYPYTGNSPIIPKIPVTNTDSSNPWTSLDIKKLNAAYSCPAAEFNKCRRHILKDSGTITVTDSTENCEWLIEVENGHSIEITMTAFQVDCPNKLEFRNGDTKSSLLLNSYCGTDKPTVFVIYEPSVYIILTGASSGHSFSFNWKKTELTCCETIRMVSTAGAAELGWSSYLGIYKITDDIVNGKPSYINGTRWIQHSGKSNVGWQVSTTVNPPQWGYMVAVSDAFCPDKADRWTYKPKQGLYTHDSTLKAVCEVSTPTLTTPSTTTSTTATTQTTTTSQTTTTTPSTTTSSTATTPATSTCTYRPGIYHSYLWSQVFFDDTIEDQREMCKEKCAESTNCEAWYGVRGDASVCMHLNITFIKDERFVSGAKPRTAACGATPNLSESKCFYNQGQSVSHKTTRNIVTTSAEACRRKCAEDKECKIWLWQKSKDYCKTQSLRLMKNSSKTAGLKFCS